MARWIFAVTLALGLAWSGLWLTSSRALKADIADWFEARRAEGWQAEYSSLTVRGFPSRLDATLNDVVLMDTAGGIGWQGDFFQVLGLTYRPGHRILVWPDSQTVTLPSGPVTVQSAGLRASLIHDAEGVILRANLEADTFRQGNISLANLRVGLLDVAGTPGLYRLGMSAGFAGTPADNGLALRAEITFDRDWQLDSLAGALPQPARIDLRQGRYTTGGAQLDAIGLLEIDAQGRPKGELALTATQWPALVDSARRSGLIPPTLADTLEHASEGRRDLPLVFDAGQVTLGDTPLGKAPRLHLP
ncbi:DUF2125 domain-containing protein [Mameliella alba]|uniref:DUF2125 domain-containing protein n=1 Tax=Mameliella alba TaxID=561184 RepID=UPI0014319CF8